MTALPSKSSEVVSGGGLALDPWIAPNPGEPLLPASWVVTAGLSTTISNAPALTVICELAPGEPVPATTPLLLLLPLLELPPLPLLPLFCRRRWINELVDLLACHLRGLRCSLGASLAHRM